MNRAVKSGNAPRTLDGSVRGACLHRQYRKLIGQSVEVLLKSGVKILATLDEVSDEAVTISYDEAIVVEGKKKKQMQRTTHTYSFDEIKWTKEYLDYK